MANNSYGEASNSAENRYSSAFQDASISSLPLGVKRAIDLLRQHRDASVYSVSRAERRGRAQIVVGVTISIGPYLPPRCDPAEEGMCSPEPVLFVFDEERYPDRAPSVGSDRKDFSRAGKPHVSQPREEWPPFFCLTRASLDDWFAEYGFAAYFDRVARWLIDAAQGQLQREDGRFEPTVLPPGFKCVFDYEKTASYVEGQREIERKSGYRYGQFLNLGRARQLRESLFDQFAAAYKGPISLSPAKDHITEANTDDEGREVLSGILAWTPEGQLVGEHFTTLPSTRPELIQWASRLNIELKEPLDELIGAFNAEEGRLLVPILLCIQRPTKLYGLDSSLEILPLYYIKMAEGKDEHVVFAQHQHLLTPTRAQNLSNTTALPAVTLVGAGALGSKLFSHWYRGGAVDWTILDPAIAAPHNMVRHGLQPESVGSFKASELPEAFDAMYDSANGTAGDTQVERKRLHTALKDESVRRRIEDSIVVDTTGSPAALQELGTSNVPKVAAVARVSVVDEGRKGVLFVEGENRNPRIDDLRAALYQLGLSNDIVSDWLCRRPEQENEQSGLRGEEVEIGLNCASDTFRLADDEVSFHAAQLSMRLRNWLGAHHGPAAASLPRPPESQQTENASGSDPEEQAVGFPGGRVGLSDAETGWHEWRVHEVTAVRANGWEIRVAGQAVSKMEQLMQKYRPSETGGITLGRINRSRQILYVTKALPPPPDSKHSPTQFIRGAEGVRTSHKSARDRTGAAIGYAAEWHTHPNGPSSLSIQDYETARRTRQRFRGSFFPAVILVLTPDGLITHVEDPLSPQLGAEEAEADG